MPNSTFEWDEVKSLLNIEKHGVSFYEAQHAFFDDKRVIAEDVAHSQDEQRYYCFGLNEEKTGILTVRFTYRNGRIRIFGAGYWRRGKKIYEQANPIH
ncbi:BrnT family toxin [Spongiibacter sp. KMU-158]|uniref:BrnT family toxin n=1 Tax=Spongiibacter pelagi TaxID=2760804 RepID=A0A927GV74_9GAMM|nr:BrnT family toxin [Spongiibacter pelagi]MBD2858095.1 BrnT family toxin [Spongiibacter pelagi]